VGGAVVLKVLLRDGVVLMDEPDELPHHVET
jgi:hypothetical protein